MDDLLQTLAFKLRYHAAIAVLDQLGTPEQRLSLVADVVAPRPRLEQLTLELAREQLHNTGERSLRC